MDMLYLFLFDALKTYQVYLSGLDYSDYILW